MAGRPSRNQQVLNLGIPDALRPHPRAQILAVLDEYDIGYIKWDHNRDLIEAGDQPARPARRPRADAGALPAARRDPARRTPGWRSNPAPPAAPGWTWASWSAPTGSGSRDYIDPLERQAMLRWTTQLLPPELMGSHIASGRSHTTGRDHDLAFRAATAMFGHLGIEWDLARAGPEEITELGAWIVFYKEQRDLLARAAGPGARLDFPDPVLVLPHGVVARGRRRGRDLRLRGHGSGSDVGSPGPAVWCCRAWMPDRRYRVRAACSIGSTAARPAPGRPGGVAPRRRGPGVPSQDDAWRAPSSWRPFGESGVVLTGDRCSGAGGP